MDNLGTNNMAKDFNINQYVSPNIVIVPTVSFIDKPQTSIKPLADESSANNVSIFNVTTKNHAPISYNTNLVQIIPDVSKTTNIKAAVPFNPEDKSTEMLSDNVIKKPPDPQIEKSNEEFIFPPLDSDMDITTEIILPPSDKMEKTNEEMISTPNVAETPNKSTKLENVKLTKPCNSWASNYLQSIGQSQMTPLKNSPSPAFENMASNDKGSLITHQQIKINLLSHPTEKKETSKPALLTDETTKPSMFTRRIDTMTWFTQFAAASNAKLSLQTNDPLPKIHLTPIAPKVESTSNANSSLALLTETCSEKSDTSKRISLPTSPSVDKVKPHVNHYECLDKIFTDIKGPNNKYINVSCKSPGSEAGKRNYKPRYTKSPKSLQESAMSKQEYENPDIEHKSSIDKTKQQREINDSEKLDSTYYKDGQNCLSFIRKKPEGDNSRCNSIYYRDNNNTEPKIIKTTGTKMCMEQSKNKRKRRDTEREWHSRKRKKSSPATNKLQNKSFPRSETNDNIPRKDSSGRSKRKRKRLNSGDIHSETNKIKRTRRTPQTELNSPNLENSPNSAKSVCSLKSVIQTTDKLQTKHPRIQHPINNNSSDEDNGPLDYDLRAKLNKKINSFKNYSKINRPNLKNEKTRENLRITINRSDEENTVTNSAPDTSEPKPKYKEIKLVIKVVCQNKDNNSDSSSSDESDGGHVINTTCSDLSFLDDINIDEIVNSLTHSPSQDSNQKFNDLPKKIKNKVVKNLNNIWSGKNFVQPINLKNEIKIENLEGDKNSCEAPVENERASDLDKLSPKACYDEIKNKTSAEEHVDNILNIVKQERQDITENHNTDCTTNESIVNLHGNENVLKKIEDIKHEKIDVNRNNATIDSIQVNDALLDNVVACKSEHYNLQNHKNKINYKIKNITKKNSDCLPVNKDDIEIIEDNNVLIIDLTIEEPYVSQNNKHKEQVTCSDNNEIIDFVSTYSINYYNDEMNTAFTENCSHVIKSPENASTNKEEHNNKININQESDNEELIYKIRNKEEIHQSELSEESINNKNSNNVIKLVVDIKTEKDTKLSQEVHTEISTHEINIPGEVITDTGNNDTVNVEKEIDTILLDTVLVDDSSENEPLVLRLPIVVCDENNTLKLDEEVCAQKESQVVPCVSNASFVALSEDIICNKELNVERTANKVCTAKETYETKTKEYCFEKEPIIKSVEKDSTTNKNSKEDCNKQEAEGITPSQDICTKELNVEHTVNEVCTDKETYETKTKEYCLEKEPIIKSVEKDSTTNKNSKEDCNKQEAKGMTLSHDICINEVNVEHTVNEVCTDKETYETKTIEYCTTNKNSKKDCIKKEAQEIALSQDICSKKLDVKYTVNEVCTAKGIHEMETGDYCVEKAINAPEKVFISNKDSKADCNKKEAHIMTQSQDMCPKELNVKDPVSKISTEKEINEPKKSTTNKNSEEDGTKNEAQGIIKSKDKEITIKQTVNKVCTAKVTHPIKTNKLCSEKEKTAPGKISVTNKMSGKVCTEKEAQGPKISKDHNEINIKPININSDKKQQVIKTKEICSEKVIKGSAKVTADRKNNKGITRDKELIEKQKPVMKNKPDEEKSLEEKIEIRMSDYLKEQFKVTQLITHGKFSKVFQCQDTSGEIYAIKVSTGKSVSRNIEKNDMLEKIQKDFPKPNLSTVFLINGFALNRSWCFLMEYYPWNLQKALNIKDRPFHIDEVQNLSRQLVSAIMMLMFNNIVHADIKPKHILLDSTHKKLKLCGFDQSYYSHTVKAVLPNIGTLAYRAPEIIMGYSASFSIDVWAAAVVMFELATKQKLFVGAYNNSVLYKQLSLMGNMPEDMIYNSKFARNHFSPPQNQFRLRYGEHGQHVKFYPYFYKKNNIKGKLIHIYYKQFWQASTPKLKAQDDYNKLLEFHELLDKMLEIHPRARLAIEFVSIDPFLYAIYS